MWRINWITVILLAATLLPGCSKREEKTAPGAAEDAAAGIVEKAESGAAKADADIQAEVEAKLAEADKLDGTADKIVHRCASCALGMDGKSENALEVAGYTLHFCTGQCKESFAENVTRSILDLKIPEK